MGIENIATVSRVTAGESLRHRSGTKTVARARATLNIGALVDRRNGFRAPGIVAAMSPRARVILVVAAVAAARSRRDYRGDGAHAPPTWRTSTVATPRPGVPPLVLDLGVRTDPEAKALRRAAAVLYERGRRRQASGDLRALRLRGGPGGSGALRLARWLPAARRGSAATTGQRRGATRARPGAVLARSDADAESSWRLARLAEPDSLYAVRAGDFLHPELPVPGLPTFVPSFASPAALRRLSPPEQYAFLRRRAEGGDTRDHLLFGAALQRLGRPASARREFERAAALSPNDPDALTARGRGPFRQGSSCAGVLAPRAAHAAVPACGDRALPSRPAARLDGKR